MFREAELDRREAGARRSARSTTDPERLKKMEKAAGCSAAPRPRRSWPTSACELMVGAWGPRPAPGPSVKRSAA